MKVLVAYESRSGRTRRAAEAVAAAVRARGSDATLKALAETTAEDIEQADAVAVGSWVEGFIVVKVGPAKAALEAIGRLPAMGGKPAAVFCTYAANPRATLATLRRSRLLVIVHTPGRVRRRRRRPTRRADGGCGCAILKGPTTRATPLDVNTTRSEVLGIGNAPWTPGAQVCATRVTFAARSRRFSGRTETLGQLGCAPVGV